MSSVLSVAQKIRGIPVRLRSGQAVESVATCFWIAFLVYLASAAPSTLPRRHPEFSGRNIILIPWQLCYVRQKWVEKYLLPGKDHSGIVHGRNEDIMKKVNNKETSDDLRPEYDLSKLKGGVRGKYAKRFQKGTNLVLLSPDVAKYFPDEQSVNAALRSLVGIAKAELRHTN